MSYLEPSRLGPTQAVRAPAGHAYPRHCPWADALSVLSGLQTLPDVLDRLDLEMLEDTMVIRQASKNDVVLGRLFFSWGTTLSAQCKTHARCKLLVKFTVSGVEAVQADLVKWLAWGATVSAEEHRAGHVDEIKRRHGMRPRPQVAAKR